MANPQMLKPQSGWRAGICAVVLAIVGAMLFVGGIILAVAGGAL